MKPKGKCVVIGAGDFFACDIPDKNPGDLFIAADGGEEHFKSSDIIPDLFIGDLDSIPSPPENTEAVLLERRKDDTDTLAAVKAGLERGYREFLLLGALGGKRISHTVANIQTLEFIKNREAFGMIKRGGTELICLDPLEEARFVEKHGWFSLFSLTNEATVEINGSDYDGNVVIERGYPLGVSNRFSAAETTVKVKSGRVLLIAEYSQPSE